MTTTDSPRRALVVGLGISGISAAIALHKAGWTPVIIEKAPARRSGGYFIGFFGMGRIAAERLGILDHMHNRIPNPSITHQLDRHGNRQPGVGFADAPGGPWMMLRGDVERAAYAALPEDVEVRYATVPSSIEQDADGATVTFDHTPTDGSQANQYSERFDLVVGADGLRSTVRKLAFGPDSQHLRPLNYMIAAFALPQALPGLKRDEGAILAEPGRSFWVFPFADHDPTVLFSYRTDDVDAEFTKPASQRLREVYGPEPLGELMESALTTLENTDEYLFDSVSQVALDNWHRGRVVLIGDAAWCVTLYAGMGATTGVAGAELLGAALQRNPDDLEAALTEWEATLRPITEELQTDGRDNRKFFTPADERELRQRSVQMTFRRLMAGNRLLARLLMRTKRFRIRNGDLVATLSTAA